MARMNWVVYSVGFAATNPRMMKPLRGDVDTLFKMLNWRFGLAGPVVAVVFEQFRSWAAARHHELRKPTSCLRALQVIFYGVAQAHAESLFSCKRCVVGFLSHPKSFTKKSGAIEMPGHAVFSLLLEFLVEAGYVTVSISKGNLRCSYFEPTARFPSFSEPLEPVLLSRGGVVQLRTGRDEGHEIVDPRDYTPEQAAHISSVAARLTAVNEHALLHSYHVVEHEVFCQVYAGKAIYHAVYNDGSIHRGGRLYNEMQSFPQRNRDGDPTFKPLRPTLHIDGKPTAEVDFRNLHFAMLYNMKGLPCPADCYAVPVDGWDVPDDDPLKRALLKLVFLAVPNCGDASRTAKQNRRSGINTTASQMKRFTGVMVALRTADLGDLQQRVEDGEFEEGQAGDAAFLAASAEWYGYGVPSHVTPELLLECLIRHHVPIAGRLYSGIGSFLQSLDAGIALRVIERFNELGKPIIGVHDSFRVWVEDVELLKRFMREEYAAVFPGFTPDLKVEQPPHGMPTFPSE